MSAAGHIGDWELDATADADAVFRDGLRAHLDAREDDPDNLRRVAAADVLATKLRELLDEGGLDYVYDYLDDLGYPCVDGVACGGVLVEGPPESDSACIACQDARRDEDTEGRGYEALAHGPVVMR